MINFYANTNDDGYIISQTRKDGDAFWYEQDGWQSSRKLTDDNGLYIYKIVDDKVVETTDDEKAEQYKQSAIAALSPITTEFIYSGEVTYNDIPIKISEYSFENFERLANLAGNEKYDSEIEAEVLSYTGAPFKAEDVSEISRLFGLHQLKHMNAHGVVEANILRAVTVGEINQIVEDYKND